MATGTGKTVVMAATILYHYLNRQEYPNNPIFADNFLLVAPGITIRDRLGVLRYNPIGKDDYYQQRYLIPSNYLSKMGGLNARITITNFHAFEPKTLQGNKKSPLDGKMGADGKKQEAKESFNSVARRVLPFQTIYFDPPYGIKYGGNWQIKLNDRDVQDGKDGNTSAVRENKSKRSGTHGNSESTHIYRICATGS